MFFQSYFVATTFSIFLRPYWRRPYLYICRKNVKRMNDIAFCPHTGMNKATWISTP